MNSLKARILGSLAITVTAFLLIEWLWMRVQSLWGLTAVFAISIPALIWAHGPETRLGWPRPEPEAAMPPTSLPLPLLPASAILTGAGALCLLAALIAALTDHQGWTLAAVVGGAACWYPLVEGRLRPVPMRWATCLLCLALAFGSLFRLYKGGEIPTGLITVDEPRLIMYAHEILDGKRESFNTVACEGQVTFYAEALAMKLFGMDIHGFRMSCILCGIAMIGLMALLGTELAGLRIGLLAAGFTSLALWPVTFSRAEYLMDSSYLPILGCIWLLLKGLRRGSPIALVLAGCMFGLCFSVYQAGKLMPLLVALLVVLTWIQRKDWRRPLVWALLPFSCGALLTLAPLLLWVVRDPKFAFYTYFAPLFLSFSAGAGLMETQGVLGKINSAVGRILPQLPKLTSMFSTQGGMRPWYFLVGEPIIDHCTLFLFLCGLAICLVRFRRPAFAFLVLWWFLGLTPALASNPLLNMDERRIMLCLPATLFIASIGLLGLLDLFTRNLSWGAAERVVLAVCLIFFAYLGCNTWHTYFYVINDSRSYHDYNHANFDNTLRAIFKQNKIAPVTVISFKKLNDNSWWGGNSENELVEHWNALSPIPRQIAATDESYFKNGGLFGFLKDLSASGPKEPDPLIVLTPFHYYLEPFLVKYLEGKCVDDVPPLKDAEGVDFQDEGYDWDSKSEARLIRLSNFDPSIIGALEARWDFPYTVEEMKAPARLGSGEAMNNLWITDLKYNQILNAYATNPEAWKVIKAGHFSMPDVWFWVTDHNFPVATQLPLRLRANWTLNVPSDGDYCFGASANIYTAIRVDGKKVFSFIPTSLAYEEGAREGYLGDPVFLKKGPHSFKIEQLNISSGGNYNHLIRGLWKRPGGTLETLPLEFLSPQPRNPKG